MFVSGGNLVRSQGDFSNEVVWQGDTSTWGNWNSNPWLWMSYSAMYRRQLWVSVVVNKRAGLIARLPLKTYLRATDGRQDAGNHPYAQLLRRPNKRLDRVMFWTWVTATRDIYGEAMLGKQRDPGGRPVQLMPLHPTAMQFDADKDMWTFDNGRLRIENIPREDIIHFSSFDPDTLDRGMSPLEPLRATLENEAAARQATSSFWKRGARPGYALTHPNALSQPAQDRLKAQWSQIAAGADKTGETVVLEEGMKPEKLDLTAEEAQYIESRKLNREEVVAAYDMPPPAVHILDRATFSNITEQFRSVYRDTAAPILNYFEAVLDTQLRGSIRRGASEPDFGEDVYAEFLLDEVLRGDFEQRVSAYQTLHAMGWPTNEIRALENRPPVEGGDTPLVNAALVPLSEASRKQTPEVANNTVRTLMGRLNWQESLDDIDPAALVAGLNGDTETVLNALQAARDAGDDVPAFRQRLRGMETT